MSPSSPQVRQWWPAHRAQPIAQSTLPHPSPAPWSLPEREHLRPRATHAPTWNSPHHPPHHVLSGYVLPASPSALARLPHILGLDPLLQAHSTPGPCHLPPDLVQPRGPQPPPPVPSPAAHPLQDPRPPLPCRLSSCREQLQDRTPPAASTQKPPLTQAPSGGVLPCTHTAPCPRRRLHHVWSHCHTSTRRSRGPIVPGWAAHAPLPDWHGEHPREAPARRAHARDRPRASDDRPGVWASLPAVCLSRPCWSGSRVASPLQSRPRSQTGKHTPHTASLGFCSSDGSFYFTKPTLLSSLLGAPGSRQVQPRT